MMILQIFVFFAATQAAPQVHDTAWDPPAVRAYFDGIDASVHGGQVTPNWIDGGTSFWFKDNQEDIQIWRSEAGWTADVIPREAVTDILTSDTWQVTDVAADGEIVVRHGDQLKTIDLAKGRITQTEEAGLAPRSVRRMFPINGYDRREQSSPDGEVFATLDGDQFGIRSAEGAVLWTTDDGEVDDYWFFASDIWESSGSAWSPDGQYVIARRHNVSAVTPQLILDQLGTNEAVSEFSYWARAGQPLPVTSFSIFNVKTGARVDADAIGSPDHFAFFIDWDPDGDAFYVIRYNRTVTTQSLLRVDATTGQVTTLLTDQRDDGWVKWPSGPKTLSLLPSGDGFLWRSDESGYFHWYRHDDDGRRLHRVTDGPFDVGGVVHVDEAARKLWVHAQTDIAHPYDEHLAVTELDEIGTVRQLTQMRGEHEAIASPDGAVFIVSGSSLTRPPETVLMSPDGAVLAVLEQADVDLDFRASWSPPEEFTATSADGQGTVHGLIHKPDNFDPSKSYPVVDRIYGAMQSFASRRVYPGSALAYPGGEYQKIIPYLNSLGFIVVTLDAPGTPGLGRAHNLATYATWPEGVIDDHVAAIRQVAENRPYMDLSRVAIVGNSWGGYMALRGMIEAPDFFKVASASVPETDLVDHVHWIEWQLGDVKENEAHYLANDISSMVDQIKGSLLIIAGTADSNVPISNTMKLLDALAEAGRRYELVIFPGTNHAHQGRGDRYAYAANRIGIYLLEHLGTAE